MTDVFLSVGGTTNDEQEKFVDALEKRLRAEGLIPNTVGRNTFSAEAPLRTVSSLMSRCDGTVVLALERTLISRGTERRGGPKEREITNISLATPWNQIEAAMSYAYGKPLLVIVEEGIKEEGLLEAGYDWYVQKVPLNPASLNTVEFNGILASWKEKIKRKPAEAKKAVDQMTISELVGALKPAQLWTTLGAILAVVVGAFIFGTKLL